MQVQTHTTAAIPRLAMGWQAATKAPAPGTPAQAPLDLLEQFGSRQTVQRGHEFYAGEDPAEFCYRVVSGIVRSVGLDGEGRRHITDFSLPGDLFGFDSLDTHHLAAEAVTEVVVVRYPRRVIDSLTEQNSALARRLCDLTLQNLRRAHERMFLLGRMSAGERIAAFLIEMAARASVDGCGSFALLMTRADIADYLGLTLETVSRTMAQLCRDGIIAQAKSGIEIRNRAALERFGVATRH